MLESRWMSQSGARSLLRTIAPSPEEIRISFYRSVLRHSDCRDARMGFAPCSRMRANQLSFSGSEFRKHKAFGGSLLRKKCNQVARPISCRHPMHVILKSSAARGAWSFLLPKNRQILDNTLKQMGRRYGVRIIGSGNAGNHLHLLIKCSNRTSYLSFIRALTGTMVRRICGTGALARRFFDFRPYSRVVSGGGRDFFIARAYVHLNELEGRGRRYSKKRLKDVCTPQNFRNFVKHPNTGSE